MKRLYIEVMTSRDALRQFARAWKSASKNKSTEATIGVESISALTALLSPKRLELLRHVAQHPGLSVRALSIALGRDYKNVHTDVCELESRYLLERDQAGRVQAPYDELVIRAPLRDAA